MAHAFTPDLPAFKATLDAHGYPYAEVDDGIVINGGYVDLPNLTTLPEGVTFGNGGYVYLPNLTTLPEGVTFANGGDVYLPNLTTLPEGVAFANGGGVYLPSLTTLPEGTTFANGGSVYLGGLEGEYHTYRGESVRLKTVDGFTMLILSERAAGEYTIFRAAYFGGGDIEKLKRCYIARLGDFYAHGETVEKAMRDVRLKAMERDFDQDELVAEITARGTVLIEDFRLITGACEEGTRHGMEQAGLDPKSDELPLDVVMGAAFGPYGERFKALFAREAA